MSSLWMLVSRSLRCSGLRIMGILSGSCFNTGYGRLGQSIQEGAYSFLRVFHEIKHTDTHIMFSYFDLCIRLYGLS